MNRHAKRVVLAFLMTTVAGLLSAPIAFYFYDPLMLYHRPWGRQLTFSSDLRVQAAGIINNFEFDSLILGTSMLQNTSGQKARALLGGRFVNLSAAAGDPAERAIILRRAFEKKDISTVIYSVDAYGREGNPSYPMEEFAYLYDHNPFNDIRAYYHPKYFRCLLLWSASRECVGLPGSPEMPASWYRSKSHRQRFGGIDKWFAAENNRQIRISLQQVVDAANNLRLGRRNDVPELMLKQEVEATEEYIDKYILAFARKHPNTTFHLIMPPYSRLRYAIWYQLNQLDAYRHEAAIRYLVAAQVKLKNIRLYGFEHQDFLDEIANYKDTGHYHPSINLMMVRSIKQGANLLTADVVDEYLAISRRKALEYDLIGVADEVQSYLMSDP